MPLAFGWYSEHKSLVITELLSKRIMQLDKLFLRCDWKQWAGVIVLNERFKSNISSKAEVWKFGYIYRALINRMFENKKYSRCIFCFVPVICFTVILAPSHAHTLTPSPEATTGVKKEMTDSEGRCIYFSQISNKKH